MQTQRILVTGGAGFLGSHLCQRLVHAGHDVLCLDNFFTSQKTNISHLLGEPNFELIRHDVTEPIRLEVDRIYNLACPASPVHYQYNPIKTMKVSVLGAINMLGLAKRCHARILQASTSEVYGDPPKEIHPQTEDYRGNVNPIGVRACYDEGKRAAETLCFDYHRSNGVDVRVVRIFNTYGPNMHPYDGRVISNFICQALGGEDITIYGEGQQTRSFCYCDDLLDAMQAMMNQPGGKAEGGKLKAEGGKAAGTDAEEGLEPSDFSLQTSPFIGPVNIGNPGEFTIRELAQTIIEMTGSKSKLVHLPLPKDDPTQRQPDISLAKEKLGWEPKVPLRDGLAKTIAYFRGLDMNRFRKPTDHTAHKSSYGAGKG